MKALKIYCSKEDKETDIISVEAIKDTPIVGCPFCFCSFTDPTFTKSHIQVFTGSKDLALYESLLHSF